MPVDLFEDEGSTFPAGIARFVQEDLRPFLVQHEQAALDAWERWLASQEERRKAVDAWETSRGQYLQDLASLTEDDPRRNPHSPPGGQVWFNGRAVLGEGRSMLVAGWGPRELYVYTGPEVEYPLPPPQNRDLSPDDRWVALLAVHDAVRIPRERIVPVDSEITIDQSNPRPGRSRMRPWSQPPCIPFAVLCKRAEELTESELPALRRILDETRAHLPDATPESQEGPARKLNPTDREILEHCRPKAHKGERIASHIRRSNDHVRRVLARLVHEGRLRKTEDGYRTV